jgi:hypothetical protein
LKWRQQANNLCNGGWFLSFFGFWNFLWINGIRNSIEIVFGNRETVFGIREYE